MHMFTKILFLCSALNVGDVSHTNQLTEHLRLVMPEAQTVSIDANLNIAQTINTYQEITSAQKKPYIVCAVGEKGVNALAQLEQQKLLDHSQAYVAASVHQNMSDLKNISLDFLAIPEVSVTDEEKTHLSKNIPALSYTFAVPSQNPSLEILHEAYDLWKHPQRPALNKDSIVIMLPGDAPGTNGVMKYFTKPCSKKLFDNVYKLWKQRGKKHHIIIQNGPRTGKHDPSTGTVACSHEYKKNENPEQAVDAVSKYFVALCKEKNMDYTFFNFAFELDGSTKKSTSVFNQLLYLAQQPNNDNYFILPGESVSMLGQIPLYMFSDKIIVFKPDSMNESHNNIFNLGLQRGYYGYFSQTGDIITTPHPSKRTEDDGKKVITELIAGYKKKLSYKLFEHYIKLTQTFGQLHDYEMLTGENNAVMSGYPESSFNNVFLKTKDDSIIKNLQKRNIPFVCYPLGQMEHELRWLSKLGLTKVDDQVIQLFEKLQTFNYHATNTTIEIRLVTTEQDLTAFSHIASIAFACPQDLIFNYCKPSLYEPNFPLYIATMDNKALACGMIAIINDLPGLYWGAVLPEFQKQGIATACTLACLNFVKSHGYDAVMTINVPASIKLCQKIGFKPIGTMHCFASL